MIRIVLDTNVIVSAGCPTSRTLRRGGDFDFPTPQSFPQLYFFFVTHNLY